MQGVNETQIVSFHKYHGAGNDFVVVDNTNGVYDFFCSNPEKIRQICHRRFGVGADGFIAITKTPDYDFRMTYFNCDGYEGTLCGNGARCAVAFARQLGLLQYNEARFLACDGAHFAIYDELHSQVHVKMNMDDVGVTKIDDDSYFINTGSPHLVQFVGEKLDEIDVDKLGRQLCESSVFKATKGANVNFVQEIGAGGLRVRTFERGVGGETFACGTGSVAAVLVRASVASASNQCTVCAWDDNHTHVKVKGGELCVAFERNAEGGGFSEVFLVGPAQYVYSGTYTCQ